MEKLLRNKRTIILFLLPATVIYLVSVVVPIFWSAYYSFFDWNGYGKMNFFGISNYIKMFKDSELWTTVVRTLIFSFWQIVLQVGGGLLVAVLLTHIAKRPRKFFQSLYYLPVIISSVALCQMFIKIFAVVPVGLFDQLLSLIKSDWIHLEWLSDPNKALGMVIMTAAYKSIPVYMLIFYSALLTVPDSLIEAARIDGANSFTIFLKVKLPHIRPTVFANIILVLNGSLRVYDIPRLLTGGGPYGMTETQAYYMYKMAFTSQKYGYGSAIAILIVIESLMLALLVRQMDRMGSDE